MIEAGIVAVAILVVGIAGIVAYRREQAANRAALSYGVGGVRDALKIVSEELTAAIREVDVSVDGASNGLHAVADSLAPLCESLAESLTARMSTIDSDMADLRTRVETGPGRRTLKL